MKNVNVDQDACIGCGFCYMSFPNLFKCNDNGLSEPVNEKVDDKNNELVMAEEGCPTGAIKVQEENNEEEK